MAAKQRRNKAAARIAVFGLGGAAVLALVVGGLVAVVPRGAGRPTDSVPAVSTPPSPPELATARSRAELPVRPIVAEGRTDLGDSVFAERAGGDVTVHFDTELLRTRLEEKFERVVRMTLPKVYGSEVGARLDSISPGQFVRGGNLLSDLPARGIALALPARNRTLMLYPVTRQGLDGPIVVAYRATVAQ
jgi:hypothetical protein